MFLLWSLQPGSSLHACLTEPCQAPRCEPPVLKGPVSLLRLRICRKKQAEKAESQEGVSQVSAVGNVPPSVPEVNTGVPPLPPNLALPPVSSGLRTVLSRIPQSQSLAKSCPFPLWQRPSPLVPAQLSPHHLPGSLTPHPLPE